MLPPGNRQPSGNTTTSCSPSTSFRETSTSSSSPSSCGAGEVLVEICTPGARAPIHFMEGFAASCRGSSRGARTSWTTSSTNSTSRTFLSSTLVNPPPASAPASPTPPRTNSCGKHHRRTSTPLDGVCLTLLGVSTGLKTPGVDAWSLAEALVESGVDLRTRNVRGMTPLHLACSAGQVDVARVLLLAGADSHARDYRSRCPLHMAALCGKSEIVSCLLTCGADPNKASDLGTTALHNAALLGRVEVSRALLRAGADANSTDHNSFSPLYLASQSGHTQIVLDLLAAGADAGIKTSKGFTPLHVAARCGRLSVLRALLDAGEDVNSLSTPAETTPLHLSAGFSRLSCVQELLKRGADPLKENKRGTTPRDIVGTLIIPVSASQDGPSDSKARFAREVFDKKLEQGARVKVVLTRAQRWQRRRGLVLLWENLRNRTPTAESVSATVSAGGVCGGRYGMDEERPRRRDSSKRFCMGSPGSRTATASCPGAERQGWVVLQLCTHPDPVLMKNVIGFL